MINGVNAWKRRLGIFQQSLAADFTVSDWGICKYPGYQVSEYLILDKKGYWNRESRPNASGFLRIDRNKGFGGDVNVEWINVPAEVSTSGNGPITSGESSYPYDFSLDSENAVVGIYAVTVKLSSESTSYESDFQLVIQDTTNLY